jgi:antitoxin (DNA-binding transcriptional repressor) of toxin-antitoxin stability system
MRCLGVPALKDTFMKIPAAESPSVGIREFRAALAEYIDADTPVTVTRHGQAVGLFVPLRRPSAEALQRLRAATAKVQEVMPLSDQETEDLVADFEALRKGRPRSGAGEKGG